MSATFSSVRRASLIPHRGNGRLQGEELGNALIPTARDGELSGADSFSDMLYFFVSDAL